MIFERFSVGDDWDAAIPYKIILEKEYTLENFLKEWLEHIKSNMNLAVFMC